MKHPNMDAPLLALRTGRISFQTFERRTRNVWAAIAKHILRRWRGPIAVSEQDIVQELYVSVWTFTGHWDEKHGQSITNYVVWNAYDKAKKWLHQQRNAYRRDDSSPSRCEMPFSAMRRAGSAEDDWDPEEALLNRVALEPDRSPAVDDILTGRRTLELAALAYPEHAPAMVALAKTGDLDLAAQIVYDNPLLALAGVDTMNDARRLVSSALQAVA